MYKLVIVDDEKTIREGLRDMINWRDLGFYVAAEFDDGREAIEYLKKEQPDVILSDVKMTFMSGLDIARHVHEQGYRTRVVIISGYREFEYAREAALYGVKNYLLKPTRINEIRKTFTELKLAFDKETTVDEKAKIDQQKRGEAATAIIKQMLYEIDAGRTDNIDRLVELLSVSGVQINVNKSPIVVFLVHLPVYTYLDRDWDYIKSNLIKNYDNFINENQKRVKYIVISDNYSSIRLAAIGIKTDDRPDDILEAIYSDFTEISFKIRQLLDFEMKIEIAVACENLNSLKAKRKSEAKHRQISEDTLSAINDYRKKIAYLLKESHISELKDLFVNLLQRFRYFERGEKLNILIDLLGQFKVQLGGYDFYSNIIFDYEKLFEAYTDEDIKAWLFAILDEAESKIEAHHNNMDIQIIHTAKEFIENNYMSDISLDSIARKVYLSAPYFSKLFKQYTGKTFIDYLTKIRIEKAKELLLDRNNKVYEVSTKVGYQNEKYFYKIFKEYTGLTPKEYLRTLEKRPHYEK